MVHHHHRAAFRIFALLQALFRLGHLVVVNVEALVEPGGLLQDGGADERRRVPALRLQNFGQRDRGRLQREAARIADVVHSRVGTGENAGMRRRSERDLGHCVFKQRAFCGQSVQRGRLDVRVAITMQPVRAQRVDRDDNEIQGAQPRASLARRGALGHRGPACNQRHERRGTDHQRQPVHGSPAATLHHLSTPIFSHRRVQNNRPAHAPIPIRRAVGTPVRKTAVVCSGKPGPGKADPERNIPCTSF